MFKLTHLQDMLIKLLMPHKFVYYWKSDSYVQAVFYITIIRTESDKFNIQHIIGENILNKKFWLFLS